MIHVGGYHENIERISLVHRRDIMIHVGGYHEYVGGCSVHWRDIMSTSGDAQDIKEIS